jgi:hypothetical protein
MSGEGRRRDPGKERFWRRTLRQQKSSGLSACEFCSRRGLAESAFYAWRREIQKRDRQASPSRLLARPSRAESVVSRGRPKFLSVNVAGLAAFSAVEIALPSGIVLRIGRECEHQTLRTVLSAVLREVAEESVC